MRRESSEHPLSKCVRAGFVGLLAAGVAAHRKPPNLRVRENVLTMGQAAGIAAALCAAQNVSPRHLDRKQLQRILHRSGVNLGEPSRVEQLLT